MGAARAVVVRPVVHELVDDELSLSGEQVEQRFRAAEVPNTYLVVSNLTIGERVGDARRAREWPPSQPWVLVASTPGEGASRYLRRERYAVAVRSALTCHSRVAAVVS